MIAHAAISRRFRGGSRITRLNPKPPTSRADKVHGNCVTPFNTGPTAYFDEELGRYLELSDLTRVTGTHAISDFTAGGTSGNPVVIRKMSYENVYIDVPYIRFVACKFDSPLVNQYGGVDKPIELEWCDINSTSVGPAAMSFACWSAYRTSFGGSSDGGKINGGVVPQVIRECFIRITGVDEDHGDGLQAELGPAGTVNVEACNISAIALNGIGAADAAIICGEMTSSTSYHLTVSDCLLESSISGGGEILRAYEGALSSGITYVITGNRFRGRDCAPISRGNTNTTPYGQITASNNVWDDDGTAIPAF